MWCISLAILVVCALTRLANSWNTKWVSLPPPMCRQQIASARMRTPLFTSTSTFQYDAHFRRDKSSYFTVDGAKEPSDGSIAPMTSATVAGISKFSKEEFSYAQKALMEAMKRRRPLDYGEIKYYCLLFADKASVTSTCHEMKTVCNAWTLLMKAINAYGVIPYSFVPSITQRRMKLSSLSSAPFRCVIDFKEHAIFVPEVQYFLSETFRGIRRLIENMIASNREDDSGLLPVVMDLIFDLAMFGIRLDNMPSKMTTMWKSEPTVTPQLVAMTATAKSMPGKSSAKGSFYPKDRNNKESDFMKSPASVQPTLEIQQNMVYILTKALAASTYLQSTNKNLIRFAYVAVKTGLQWKYVDRAEDQSSIITAICSNIRTSNPLDLFRLIYAMGEMSVIATDDVKQALWNRLIVSCEPPIILLSIFDRLGDLGFTYQEFSTYQKELLERIMIQSLEAPLHVTNQQHLRHQRKNLYQESVVTILQGLSKLSWPWTSFSEEFKCTFASKFFGYVNAIVKELFQPPNLWKISDRKFTPIKKLSAIITALSKQSDIAWQELPKPATAAIMVAIAGLAGSPRLQEKIVNDVMRNDDSRTALNNNFGSSSENFASIQLDNILTQITEGDENFDTRSMNIFSQDKNASPEGRRPVDERSRSSIINKTEKSPPTSDYPESSGLVPLDSEIDRLIKTLLESHHVDHDEDHSSVGEDQDESQIGECTVSEGIERFNHHPQPFSSYREIRIVNNILFQALSKLGINPMQDFNYDVLQALYQMLTENIETMNLQMLSATVKSMGRWKAMHRGSLPLVLQQRLMERVEALMKDLSVSLYSLLLKGTPKLFPSQQQPSQPSPQLLQTQLKVVHYLKSLGPSNAIWRIWRSLLRALVSNSMRFTSKHLTNKNATMEIPHTLLQLVQDFALDNSSDHREPPGNATHPMSTIDTSTLLYCPTSLLVELLRDLSLLIDHETLPLSDSQGSQPIN